MRATSRPLRARDRKSHDRRRDAAAAQVLLRGMMHSVRPSSKEQKQREAAKQAANARSNPAKARLQQEHAALLARAAALQAENETMREAHAEEAAALRADAEAARAENSASLAREASMATLVHSSGLDGIELKALDWSSDAAQSLLREEARLLALAARSPGPPRRARSHQRRVEQAHEREKLEALRVALAAGQQRIRQISEQQHAIAARLGGAVAVSS